MGTNDLFQAVRLDEPVTAALAAMLDDLGEPRQDLSSESPRPVVVHDIVAQMTLVIEGTGLALLGDEEISLERGTLLIVLPGCRHAFHAHEKALGLMHWHWPATALETDRRILIERYDFSCDQIGSDRPP